MTPEQMDERIAHYICEPWGDDWEAAATIAAVTHNAIIHQMYAKAGKQPPRNALLSPEDLVPRPKWWAQQSRRYLSDEESERQLMGM